VLGYSDDDIKNAAEIREWLTKQILEKQDEIEKIKITLSLIDSVLKNGSFKTAANLNIPKSNSTHNQKVERQSTSRSYKNATDKHSEETKQRSVGDSSFKEVKPIKRLKDNTLVAQVYILPNSMEIIPEETINISLDTPPFRPLLFTFSLFFLK
jgi:broad specificity polyphosphatase/5'/3'-nucleotidase SurE